jgi:hypothetical protein
VPLSKESKVGCPDDVEGHVELRWSTLGVIRPRLTPAFTIRFGRWEFSTFLAHRVA